MSFSRPFALASLLSQEGRVVPVVEDDRLVVDVEDMRSDPVEELVVVGNHDHGAGEVAHECFEPANREYVQVVRRFVQEQDVWSARQHLSEQHAELEAARQRAERIPVDIPREPEAFENRGGPGFGGVPVVVLYEFLELAEAIGVEGLVRRCQ